MTDALLLLFVVGQLFVTLPPTGTSSQCPAPPTLHAELRDVIDGDTYEVDVRLLFNHIARVRIRLLGLDTDERYTERGRAATVFAETLLRSGTITIQPLISDRTCDAVETIGRWVAAVFIDGLNVADRLRAAGHEKRRLVP